MSSLVKEDLQKKLFQPLGQSLREFIEIECSAHDRFYLCAAVTKGGEVEISMVKHFRIDLDEKYEMAEKWFLKDLEMIDGKEADTDNPYFDMHFEKVYSWEAYSCASKYAFARTLNKLNYMYLKKDLKIVNFDITYINDDSLWSSNNGDCLGIICSHPFASPPDQHFQINAREIWGARPSRGGLAPRVVVMENSFPLDKILSSALVSEKDATAHAVSLPNKVPFSPLASHTEDQM
ncbi:hypothetical protein KIL84_000518 [Mauremys mutica]|uniref:Exocyst complex component 1-like n=1 Tax=Mauremys mutica TaxID=74926 RepID=A0A9D3WZ69_9SAUR|nr:hypothetical protein KIL84_000518 [Mauremys mutica]